MSEEKPYTFRDPAPVAGRARGAFWILAGIETVLALAMAWQYGLLAVIGSGGFETREEMISWANMNDATINTIQWGLRIALLISFVLFFVWVYRANANVRALGARDLDISPGFAVGVYFIPFANLFYPPQNMNQVWKASTEAANWREQKGSALVALWWTLQIASGIGGWLSFLMKPEKAGIPALQTFTVYMLVYFCVCAVLHIVAATLVGRITRAQVAQHGRLQPTA